MTRCGRSKSSRAPGGADQGKLTYNRDIKKWEAWGASGASGSPLAFGYGSPDPVGGLDLVPWNKVEPLGRRALFTRISEQVIGGGITTLQNWTQLSNDTPAWGSGGVGFANGDCWLFPHGTRWRATYNLYSDSGGSSGFRTAFYIGQIYADFTEAWESRLILQAPGGYTAGGMLCSSGGFTFNAAPGQDAVLLQAISYHTSRSAWSGTVEFTRVR